MTDLWTEASRDLAEERLLAAHTAARVATVDLWASVLSSAINREDFDNRLATIGDRLDSVCASLVNDDPSLFITLRAAINNTLADDFTRVFDERMAAVQAANDLRAARRNAARRLAANWNADDLPSYSDLVGLPTLSQGQTDDLKYDSGDGLRFWLARTGVEDGEPYENTVHVEKYDPASGWESFLSYNGDNPSQRSASRKIAGSPRDPDPSDEFQPGDEVVILGGFEGGMRGTVKSPAWYEDTVYGSGPQKAWYLDVYGKQMGPYRQGDIMLASDYEAKGGDAWWKGGSKTASSADLQQAVTDYSFGRRELAVGDKVGEWTITDVGTHTVQATDGQWSTSIQIQFVDNSTEGNGTLTPAGQRAGAKLAVTGDKAVCSNCGEPIESIGVVQEGSSLTQGQVPMNVGEHWVHISSDPRAPIGSAQCTGDAWGETATPKTGSLKLAWSMQDVRNIVENKQYQTVDGMLLDGFTAGAILNVWNNLGSDAKLKLESMSLSKAADVCFKLINRTGMKTADTHEPTPQDGRGDLTTTVCATCGKGIKKTDSGWEHVDIPVHNTSTFSSKTALKGQFKIVEDTGQFSGQPLYTLQYMGGEDSPGYGVWEDVTSAKDRAELEAFIANPPEWWGNGGTTGSKLAADDDKDGDKNWCYGNSSTKKGDKLVCDECGQEFVGDKVPPHETGKKSTSSRRQWENGFNAGRVAAKAGLRSLASYKGGDTEEAEGFRLGVQAYHHKGEFRGFPKKREVTASYAWAHYVATRKTAGDPDSSAPSDGQTSYCRICGVQMEGQDYAWYALSASSPKRDVGKHEHLPARNADWPGEYNAQGELVPGQPGGGGGQYDAPAGTIYDGAANPIFIGMKTSRRRTAANVIGVWADGFGNWHAKVDGDPSPEAEAAARAAIIEELSAREGPGFAPEVVGVKMFLSGEGQTEYVETNAHEGSRKIAGDPSRRFWFFVDERGKDNGPFDDEAKAGIKTGSKLAVERDDQSGIGLFKLQAMNHAKRNGHAMTDWETKEYEGWGGDYNSKQNTSRCTTCGAELSLSESEGAGPTYSGRAITFTCPMSDQKRASKTAGTAIYLDTNSEPVPASKVADVDDLKEGDYWVGSSGVGKKVLNVRHIVGGGAIVEVDGAGQASVFSDTMANYWRVTGARTAAEDALRKASPQAWRRIREAFGPGEASDIAQDIASIAGGDPALIEQALTEYDWSSRRQGSKLAELGEPERTTCTNCGSGQAYKTSGYCPSCGETKKKAEGSCALCATAGHASDCLLAGTEEPQQKMASTRECRSCGRRVQVQLGQDFPEDHELGCREQGDFPGRNEALEKKRSQGSRRPFVEGNRRIGYDLERIRDHDPDGWNTQPTEADYDKFEEWVRSNYSEYVWRAYKGWGNEEGANYDPSAEDDIPDASFHAGSKKTASQVHVFDSTGEAYNRSQTDDNIKDGDILSIPSEGVVGFLMSAWPVAVTRNAGDLHTLTDPSQPPKGEVDKVCQNCNGSGMDKAPGANAPYRQPGDEKCWACGGNGVFKGDSPETVAKWDAAWNQARSLALQGGFQVSGSKAASGSGNYPDEDEGCAKCGSPIATSVFQDADGKGTHLLCPTHAAEAQKQSSKTAKPYSEYADGEITSITSGENMGTYNVFRKGGPMSAEVVSEWTPEMTAWSDQFYGGGGGMRMGSKTAASGDSIEEVIRWARMCAESGMNEDGSSHSVRRLSGTDVLTLCDFIGDDDNATVQWARQNAERAEGASVSRVSGSDILTLCVLAETKLGTRMGRRVAGYRPGVDRPYTHDDHVNWLRHQYALSPDDAEAEAQRRYEQNPDERKRWNASIRRQANPFSDDNPFGAKNPMTPGADGQQPGQMPAPGVNERPMTTPPRTEPSGGGGEQAAGAPSAPEVAAPSKAGPGDPKEKTVAKLVASIRETNPGLSIEAAREFALSTIERFPSMVKKTAEEDIVSMIRSSLSKDEDGFGYAVPVDLVAKLTDDQVKDVWQKLMYGEIEPVYFDSGMGKGHAVRMKAHNLVTNILIGGGTR